MSWPRPCAPWPASTGAVLMANHGFVVAGKTFEDAVFNAEELEENAKLLVLTRGQRLRLLTSADIAALEARFGK